MSKRDIGVAALTLIFGVAAAHESAKLPFGTVRNPGPGFFPWWTSVVLDVLALILLAQALTRRSTAVGKGSGRIAKVAALLIVLGTYIFLLDPLGYLLSTFLLVLFMLRAIDTQRWAVALGVAAVTSVGSYVIFAIWLSIPLPRGPLQ
jgi:putative tricarboxylic transport membrane protein